MSIRRKTLPALVAALAATWLGAAPVPASQQEHAHKSPHGGHVVTVKQYHYELVADGANGFKVYLMDQQMKALPLKGVTGKAVLQLDSKKQSLALMNMGGYLHGQADLSKAKRFVAVVTLNIGGKPFSGRFTHSKTEKAPGH